MSYLASRSILSSSRFRVSNAARPAFVRNAHRLRPLPYKIEDGLGDFLTPTSLRTIAEDYQGGLLQRLNELVKDTEHEAQSVAQTVISTATDRSKVLTFNYASQALNNSFFLDTLKPPTSSEPGSSHEIQTHPSLSQKITIDFGNLTQLKSSISAAAMGMMGSGWVWMVTDQRGDLGVVATYGPGTMLARSRTHRNPFGKHLVVGEKTPISSTSTSSDTMASIQSASAPGPSSSQPSQLHPTSPTSGSSRPAPPINPATAARAFHTSPPTSISTESMFRGGFMTDDMKFTGDTLSPLFCISVHEHAWLQDYGVWGKEEYLTRFWSVLDWEKVGKAYAKWTQLAPLP